MLRDLLQIKTLHLLFCLITEIACVGCYTADRKRKLLLHSNRSVVYKTKIAITFRLRRVHRYSISHSVCIHPACIDNTPWSKRSHHIQIHVRIAFYIRMSQSYVEIMTIFRFQVDVSCSDLIQVGSQPSFPALWQKEQSLFPIVFIPA